MNLFRHAANAAIAGALFVGTAQASTVTSDGAVLTVMLGDADVMVDAVGEASLTDTGVVFLPFAEAAGTDSLLASDELSGSYMGSGISLASGGVEVALTDFVVNGAGQMTGMITATGVDGISGVVMYGRMALFDLEDAPGAFDLRMEGMAGTILADFLGVNFTGSVVAELAPAPAPAPLPGALLFFATGAGALWVRRRTAA